MDQAENPIPGATTWDLLGPAPNVRYAVSRSRRPRSACDRFWRGHVALDVRHEMEVFELVRIQGMTHPETAELLGVSAKTVQRRLQRSLLTLSETLPDLRPERASPETEG